VEFRQRSGTIHGFPGADGYDPAELLLADCDILIRRRLKTRSPARTRTA